MSVKKLHRHLEVWVSQTIQHRGWQVQRAQRIAPLDGTVRRDDRRRVEHVSERRAHSRWTSAERLKQNRAPLVAPLMGALLYHVRHDEGLVFVRAVNGGVAFLVGVPVVVRERVAERLW